MAKKKTKQQPRKRAYKKKNDAFWGTDKGTPTKKVSSGDPFTIEATPPPLVRGATPEKLALYDKVDATMRLTKPGQAFIIPAKHRGIIEAHLRRKYIEDRFAFGKIADNPDAVRVYRLAFIQKGGKK